MKTLVLPFATLAALTLSACSQPEEGQRAPAESGTPSPGVTRAARPPEPPARPAPGETSSGTLTLAGLGDLIIGKPVPAPSAFKLRGAQASDTCLIYTAPGQPGVYAIVEGDVLRRVTVTRDSPVRLVEGIGVGSAEAAVRAAFPSFTSEPHRYVGPPAKYLTQPGNAPRLRFEIGEDGTVTAIHVGMPPQLRYVEGCA